MRKIAVLRLGHRIQRDKRVTTHVALVARAMGCLKFIYSGQKDSKMENSVKKIVENWGGQFEVEYVKNWSNHIKNWKKHGKVVHLTVYGMPVQDKIKKARNFSDMLIVVGGEKVPPEVYQLADFNIAITNQPHSEVSSLCLFLDYYFEGEEIKKEFKNAKIKVIPQKAGKKVIRLS